MQREKMLFFFFVFFFFGGGGSNVFPLFIVSRGCPVCMNLIVVRVCIEFMSGRCFVLFILFGLVLRYGNLLLGFLRYK